MSRPIIEHPDIFYYYKFKNWAWYHYLLVGLYQVADVRFTNKMTIESYAAYNNFITSMKVNDKQVWYDWCDFTTYHNEIRNEDDHYFKIMRMDDDERLYSIGQSVSSPECLLINDHVRQINKKTVDVFSLLRVTNYDMRVAAVRKIKEMNINSMAGVQDYKNRPEIPTELFMPKLSILDYCRTLRESKISVALPGVGGDWTWRHTETLSVGSLLMIPEPECKVLPGMDECYVTFKRDLSDLEDKIEYYLSHDIEREEIARRGLEYYDNYLSPVGQAKWILKTIGVEYED